MALRRHCYSFVIAAMAALPVGAACAQTAGDPIGALTQVSTFNRAQKVHVGRTAAGKTACYFTEQGSSHRLDIGVTADGAFLRLETADPREATPQPPVRVFAGKQITRGQYATDEFTVLQGFDKNVDYYTPRPDRGDFVLTAKYDAAGFLDMVARGRGEFVVVQSLANPKQQDIVAIYHFNPGAVGALIACANARLQTAAPAQPAAPAAPPPVRETQAQEIVKFFDNGNIYAVQNRPRRTTVFTLPAPMRVTRIMTYHWNDGNGAPAGRIALRSRTGETFGPWQAFGEPGQGGVPSAYWVVEPDLLLPAGSYTIVDSNPSTWARNDASRNAGMASLEGYRE
jgi:hypothetical protein